MGGIKMKNKKREFLVRLVEKKTGIPDTEEWFEEQTAEAAFQKFEKDYLQEDEDIDNFENYEVVVMEYQPVASYKFVPPKTKAKWIKK